jgi:peptide chain release factor 1
MKILRSRLMDAAQSEQQQRIAKDRRSKVGTGDRSEKIRTYNFPQSRITDHRLNESFHRMEAILDGDLDALIEALTLRSQTPSRGEEGPGGEPSEDLEA